MAVYNEPHPFRGVYAINPKGVTSFDGKIRFMKLVRPPPAFVGTGLSLLPGVRRCAHVVGVGKPMPPVGGHARVFNGSCVATATSRASFPTENIRKPSDGKAPATMSHITGRV